MAKTKKTKQSTNSGYVSSPIPKRLMQKTAGQMPSKGKKCPMCGKVM